MRDRLRDEFALARRGYAARAVTAILLPAAGWAARTALRLVLTSLWMASAAAFLTGYLRRGRAQ